MLRQVRTMFEQIGDTSDQLGAPLEKGQQFRERHKLVQEMLKVLSPVMDLCRQHGRGEIGRLLLEVAELRFPTMFGLGGPGAAACLGLPRRRNGNASPR